MKITVAICTWNRASLLDQTLSSMRQLRIPEGVEWELLVVNNNCTDATDEVIAQYAKFLPVRRLFEATQGHSNARNLVIVEARGELILWTDDDVVVGPDWLAAAVHAAQHFPAAAAFGGPIDPWFPTEPDSDLLESFPALQNGFCGVDHKLQIGSLPLNLNIYGANMAIRTRMLKDNLFDISLGMRPVESRWAISNERATVGGWEEVTLLDRLRSHGYELIWVPTMRVSHYVEPLRMSHNYLIKYYVATGRDLILTSGIFERSRIPEIFKKVVTKYLYFFSMKFISKCFLTRKSWYYWSQKESFYRGQIQGYFLLALRAKPGTGESNY